MNIGNNEVTSGADYAEINVEDCPRAPPKELNFEKELLDAIHRTSFSQVFHRTLDNYLSEKNVHNLIRLLSISIIPTEEEIASQYYSNYTGIGDDPKTYNQITDIEESTPYLTFRDVERFMNYKRDLVNPIRNPISFIPEKVPILNKNEVLQRMYQFLQKAEDLPEFSQQLTDNREINVNEQQKDNDHSVSNGNLTNMDNKSRLTKKTDNANEEIDEDEIKKEYDEKEKVDLYTKAVEYLSKFQLFALYTEEEKKTIISKLLKTAVFLEYKENHSVVFEKGKSDLMYCILYGSLTEVHKVSDPIESNAEYQYQINNFYPEGYCVGVENIFEKEDKQEKEDEKEVITKTIFITSHKDDSFVQQNGKCTVLAAISRASFLNSCFDFHTTLMPESIIAGSFRKFNFGGALSDADLAYISSIVMPKTYAIGEPITDRDIKARELSIVISGKGVWGYNDYRPGDLIGSRSCFTKDKTELKSAVPTETTEVLQIKVVDLARRPAIFKKLIMEYKKLLDKGIEF